MTERCFIVLGMHRSGTSALAGSLRESGVHLGEVLDHRIRGNPKGLQEPPALLYMHEDLLEKNGGSWHRPPDQVEWRPLHKAVRNLFIESREGLKQWGFKDPRTLLVLDGWLEALKKPWLVGVFRNPMSVANSLNKRNGFEIEKGLEIWKKYNGILLDRSKEIGFPIIEYEVDHTRTEESLRRLLDELKLRPTGPMQFFNGAIQSSDPTADVRLPSDVQRMLSELRAHAIRA